MTAVMERDVTQARMAKLSAGTLQHTPGQRYTVGDRLEERAAAHPDRTFMLFEDRVVRYGEHNAAANRVAHWAARQGLGTGDAVALMMENRPEFLSTWMGLAKLGIVAALVNTHARGRALRHAFEVTGARRAVVGSECAGAVESLGLDLEVAIAPDAGDPETDHACALAALPDENPDPALRDSLRAGEDLFYVFTSGTTGLPKAARLSHMRYLGVGDGVSALAGYGPEDVIACVLPLYHGAGGMVVVSCALSQGAAVFLRRRFSASAFWDDARRHRVTACQYIGEICRYLMNQPPRPDDRDHQLRVLMGAGLGADIWQPFRERFGIEHIFEGWSSTEANTSLMNVDDVPGSCGRIPYKEMHNGRLVRYDPETDSHPRDADGFLIECDPGEPGEFIGMIPDLPDSGAGRFEGYTSAEDTERKILRDVFQKGDAWYRSGDLLRRDENDYYYFVDRIGDTFRWKSENVSTLEVAEILAGFPGVEIANVYGVRVPAHEGRAGMAALVLADPAAFDGTAFYTFTEEQLPRYAAPVFVRLTPQPDMTTTFKLRKVDLQRQGYGPHVADPLYVRDEEGRDYAPLDATTLERVGLPAFEEAEP